jgi:hypothetical protein
MNLGILAVLFSSGYAQATIIEYTYHSESWWCGESFNSDNRNDYDSTLNEIVEYDQYPDTNTTYCENDITYGSVTMGTFPDSMFEDDVDDSELQYVESSLNEADFYDYLVPNSDIAIGFDGTTPTSPTDHWSKIDEGETHDANTTYNEAITTDDEDIYGLTASTWDGTGTPDILVSIGAGLMREAAPTASYYVGYYIGTTKYSLTMRSPSPFMYQFEYFSTGETLNPATSAEWTLSDINSLGVYFTVTDASPDIRLTNTVIKVQYNYVDNYALDISHIYTDLIYHPEGTYTQEIKCDPYGITTPDFKMYVYDSDASGWDELLTIPGTPSMQTFTILPEYINESGELVIRFLDTDRTSDTIQSGVNLDYFSIRSVLTGFDADIEVYFEISEPILTPTIVFNGYTESGEYGYSAWLFNQTLEDYELWFNLTETSPIWHNKTIPYSQYFSIANILQVSFRENIEKIGDFSPLSMYIDYLVILIEVENDAPYFTSTAPTTGVVDTLFSYDANANDNETDTLTFALEGNITGWATIVESTGVVSGTPTETGSFYMNISVDDGINPSVWQNTTVTISEEPEEPPPPPSEGLSTNQVVIFVLICLFLAIILIWGIGVFD